jgi:hypothetical protein
VFVVNEYVIIAAFSEPLGFIKNKQADVLHEMLMRNYNLQHKKTMRRKRKYVKVTVVIFISWCLSTKGSNGPNARKQTTAVESKMANWCTMYSTGHQHLAQCFSYIP